MYSFVASFAQQMGGLGGAVAAALAGAAAFAASHFRPSTAGPAASDPAPAAPSSEQKEASKTEGGSEAVEVTASAAVSRRATPYPPLTGASTREEEIRMLKQKAAATELNERSWREQGKEWLAQMSVDTRQRCLEKIAQLEHEAAQEGSCNQLE